MALRKAQQRSKEYLSMNPLGKVPCLKVRTVSLAPGMQYRASSTLLPFEWIRLQRAV